jgi:spoIIIJ-associated protein
MAERDTLFTGKTVEDAIADGLRMLGLSQDQVDIEVINRGSRGLFGIGSEPAQVRLTPKSAAAPAPRATAAPAPAPVAPAPAPKAPVAPPSEPVAPAVVEPPKAGVPDAPRAVDREEDTVVSYEAISPEDEEAVTELATQLLLEMVDLMGFDATATAIWQDADEDNDHRYLLLNLEGEDLSPLIGRRGDALNNIQYLLRLMVNQRVHAWKNIVVDVDNYRQRRTEHLTQLALRIADQVAAGGRPLALEPMPSNERRIVHIALRDHPKVFTESIGEGDRRKIQVRPRQ